LANPSLAMSVVVVTPGGCADVRRLLRHLRAQTAREQLELVLVAPATPRDLAEVEGVFGQVRVVEDSLRTVVAGRVAGIRQASAPVVALTEEHSYPDPDWAAALIQAHRGPWAVVGPAMGNANPDRTTSWASFVVLYGKWMIPSTSGVVDDLPGHNSSYKRDLLLQYGDDLEKWVEFEYSLHQDLRARGYQLYQAASARTYHRNVTLPVSWFREQFYTGRIFAGVRAARWPLPQRLLYIVGSPMIPLVRLGRCLNEIRRRGLQDHLLPRVLPTMILGLVVTTLGEVVGYAVGQGRTSETLTDLELYRERHTYPTPTSR
jgi:hypothetical protein